MGRSSFPCSISIYNLSGKLDAIGLYLAALDRDPAGKLLAPSSGDLGDSLLPVRNPIRFDLQADGSIVVVRDVDRFGAEAENGVFTNV